MTRSFPRPEHLLNRELSWLAFNERVLDALDRRVAEGTQRLEPAPGEESGILAVLVDHAEGMTHSRPAPRPVPSKAELSRATP